jgi:hypothetical protein
MGTPLRTARRCIGLDVHRDFAQVAIWRDGRVSQAGRFATTPEEVRAFADSLGPNDEVALEATGNTWAIATMLIPRCPAADLFGIKGRNWLAAQQLPWRGHDRKVSGPSRSSTRPAPPTESSQLRYVVLGLRVQAGGRLDQPSANQAGKTETDDSRRQARQFVARSSSVKINGAFGRPVFAIGGLPTLGERFVKRLGGDRPGT